MSNINVENIIKNLDLEKIENDKKNGKSLEAILKEIDLKPIIRDEMLKTNPNIEEKDINNVVENIDLVKVLGSLLTNENSSEGIGQAFDELSEDEMKMLQGAGDVDVEATPAVTVSSMYCLGAISAVSSAILSAAKC